MQIGSPVAAHGISARPIFPSEQARFVAGLAEHHWLGHRLVGETMRYVALSQDGEWPALVGFGAAALACRPRDSFVGWSDQIHFKRLRRLGALHHRGVGAARDSGFAASTIRTIGTVSSLDYAVMTLRSTRARLPPWTSKI